MSSGSQFILWTLIAVEACGDGAAVDSSVEASGNGAAVDQSVEATAEVTSALNPLVEAAVEVTLVYSSEKLLMKQYRSISVMIIILKKIIFFSTHWFFFKTDFSVMSIDLLLFELYF